MGIYGAEPPAGSRGRAPGGRSLGWGVKTPLKLKVGQLGPSHADRFRRLWPNIKRNNNNLQIANIMPLLLLL